MLQYARRYAPYSALAGVIGLCIALGAWLIVGTLVLGIEIIGAASILLLATSVLLRPAQIKTAILGRQARYGGNAVLMSLAFLAIIGMINYLGVRHTKHWDVTENKEFTLSEQTSHILSSVSEPGQVKLFFTPNNYNRQQAEDLIKEYTARNHNITYQFIDPDADRRVALEYNVARDGTIIFQRGDHREVCFGFQEQDLTGTLLKVMSDKVRGVYFLTGHGERSPEDSTGVGYSRIKQALEAENYKVDTLNLSTTSTMPEDMSVLVIAAPTAPLSPQEITRLEDYVNNGGNLLVLDEPGMADPLSGMLHGYGVDITDDLVIDPSSSFFGDISSPIVNSYLFHQITKDMTGMASLFPTARALHAVDPAPADWTVQWLAQTSDASWAETNYIQQQVKMDDGEIKGPLNLVAAIEPSMADSGKGRWVVVGDADFVSNDILNAISGTGNLDLFMNSAGWLSEADELISIRPKPMDQRQVILTPPQARAVIYSSVLFVPLIVLAGGALVWWKRR